MYKNYFLYVDVESEGKGTDKVGSSLKGSSLTSMLAGSHLNRASLCVETNLELQDLHKGSIDLQPGCAKRSQSVGGDEDLAVLRVVGFNDLQGRERYQRAFHILVHLDAGFGLLLVHLHR